MISLHYKRTFFIKILPHTKDDWKGEFVPLHSWIGDRPACTVTEGLEQLSGQVSLKSKVKSECPAVKDVHVVRMVSSSVTATGAGKNFKLSFKWQGKSFLSSFHCWRTLGAE